MSENPNAMYEPVPLGARPMPEPPGLDHLLPPLPKPAEPVTPRAVAPKPAEPASPAVKAEAAKPPIPGRMAWLPEACRALFRPTRQKGIIAAGLASLGVASFAAHTFWPDTKPKPESGKSEPAPLPLLNSPPAREAAVAPPPIIEVSATEPDAIKLPPPQVNIDLPKSDLPPLDLPKIDVAPPKSDLPPIDLPKPDVLPPPVIDAKLQPAGGLQLPEVAAPPIVLPVSPAPAAAAPTIPVLSPPAAPPLVQPSTAVPATAPPPAPAIPEVASKPVEIPSTAPPTLTLPDVSAPPPPSLNLPEATTPPKSDPLPEIKEAAVPPVLPEVKPTAPSEMPRLNPLPESPEPKPAVKPAAALAPREDFDVDVHYPSSGDTWQSISREHLGDARYAEALRAYNGGRALAANQPVDIPPIHVLRRQFAGLIVAPQPAPAPEAAAPRPAGAWRTYEVPAGGMTLKELARRAFGDENLWGPIWEMNPKLRADEPVPGGTQVRLPADAKIGN